MDFIIKIGTVVRHDEKCGQVIVRRGPQRHRSLQEIAVSQNRNYRPSAFLEGQSGANCQPRTGSKTCSSIVSKEIKRIAISVGIANPSDSDVCQGELSLS